MKEFKNVSDLFKQESSTWGLRGYPFLWAEMKDYLPIVEIPAFEAELYKVIENAFTVITGKMLVEDKGIFVDRYNKGGMSRGYVSSEYWRENDIPLLISELKYCWTLYKIFSTNQSFIFLLT